jgi:hypothetical protein
LSHRPEEGGSILSSPTLVFEFSRFRAMMASIYMCLCFRCLGEPVRLYDCI